MHDATHGGNDGTSLRPCVSPPAGASVGAVGAQAAALLYATLGGGTEITPARGPPLCEGSDASLDDGVQGEPDCDLAAQPAPDYEVDQRVNC